jgi:DNA-directed RNA polymerase specialized sigma24 family protein
VLPSQQDIREPLEQLLSDRGSAEARALYTTLARYIHRRIVRLCSGRHSGLFGTFEHEELVGEVLLHCMNGALCRFNGHTIPELLAFVRTLTDRTVGHSARRRIRERDTLQGDARQVVAAWNGTTAAPDSNVQLAPDNPLSDQDSTYLQELFSAGSQARLARSSGVSRAAVTQRIQRIRARIEAMGPDKQLEVEVWARNHAYALAVQTDQ